MYHAINVIWFYSYKLINIYQNIAWRKKEMARASDKFNAIFERNKRPDRVGEVDVEDNVGDETRGVGQIEEGAEGDGGAEAV